MITLQKEDFIQIKSSQTLECVVDLLIFQQIFVNEYVTMCERDSYKKNEAKRDTLE